MQSILLLLNISSKENNVSDKVVLILLLSRNTQCDLSGFVLYCDSGNQLTHTGRYDSLHERMAHFSSL